MVKEMLLGTRDADGFESPKYLVSLIAAINDGAKAAQAGMLLFMLVGLYLLATAFSASDEDILLGKAVTISQIGASLPVSFSFAIAPLVFVFLHVYALTRYDMLGTNVRYFVGELRASVPLETDRERCRQLLVNAEFVQTLTAPRGSSLRSRFWPALAVATMAGFPVIALLLVQINALRYQSDLINWVQRLWLLIDVVAIVAFFIRNPLNGRALGRESWFGFVLHWAALIVCPLLIGVLDFAWLNVVPADADANIVRSEGLPDTWLEATQQPLDRMLCPGLKWGCRYLRVEHRTLVDHVWDDKAMAVMGAESGDYAAALAGIEGVVLTGRNLRFAVLDDSRLFVADLVGVDLRNASLKLTALLLAQIHGPDTKLQGADLSYARLAGADMSFARMAGAKLSSANLTGANLSDADLTGADLSLAQLAGADLRGAHLAGADLTVAELVGAELGVERPVGTDRLVGADLSGAELFMADLRGAHMRGAILKGADLRRANVWNADSSEQTHLELADLRGINFETRPGDDERSAWEAAIAVIGLPSTRREATERLRSALATDNTPTTMQFSSSAGLQVLVSRTTPDALKSNESNWKLPAPKKGKDGNWLLTPESGAYLDELADFLVGDLSRRNRVIAAAITRRVANGLGLDPTDAPTRLLACRLLDENKARRIDLRPDQVNQLTKGLNDAKVDCAALTALVVGAAAAPK